MPIKHVIQDDKLLLTLSGGLTIFQAGDCKPQIDHLLALVDRPVWLDLAAVDEIDAAGLQLLLLLRREVAGRGQALAMVACSAAVRAVLDLLQLERVFPDARQAIGGEAS